MRQLTIILLSVILMSTATQGIKWSRNLENSKKAASNNGKDILIYFGASWCGPCKVVERTVFTDMEFISYSKKFEMVKMYDDFQEGEKEKKEYVNAVMDRYDVHSIPHYAILKKDGSLKCKFTGNYRTSDALKEKINSYY